MKSLFFWSFAAIALVFFSLSRPTALPGLLLLSLLVYLLSFRWAERGPGEK